MSSTRRAKGSSVFHQARYASSPEFERGLLANLVAKRTALLDDKSNTELVWFLHYLSHQSGSLAAVAKDILARYPERVQTEEMAELKLKRGRACNAELVKKLRGVLDDFPLKDERYNSYYGCYQTAGEEFDDAAWSMQTKREASQNPISYPSDKFFERCQTAAEENLEKELAQICLDPKRKLTGCDPWYFPRLVETLREYQGDFVKSKSAGVVVTGIGAKVHDALDYTFYSRGLTLIEGNPRLGKSFAARSWCRHHPGQARFVEVPPSNDEASFFRALARGLGIGNFLQYKVTEIRERVQSVLFSGDLLLVLDEAHRLWPQRQMRYGCPNRINWVMSLANETDDHPSVPVAMISTPQFIELQKAAREKGLWNSAQLTGRIAHFESLPTNLEPSDLMAVAEAVLPEADSKVLRALAVYARTSERYLAAIDAIAKRARFIAMRDRRTDATTADVRRAMRESVIPADTKLLCALETGRSSKRGRLPVPDSLPDAAPGLAADDMQPGSGTVADGRYGLTAQIGIERSRERGRGSLGADKPASRADVTAALSPA